MLVITTSPKVLFFMQSIQQVTYALQITIYRVVLIVTTLGSDVKMTVAMVTEKQKLHLVRPWLSTQAGRLKNCKRMHLILTVYTKSCA